MTERGHGMVDVAKRLGMSDKSQYLWARLAQEQQCVGDGENASLKAEVSQLKCPRISVCFLQLNSQSY